MGGSRKTWKARTLEHVSTLNSAADQLCQERHAPPPQLPSNSRNSGRSGASSEEPLRTIILTICGRRIELRQTFASVWCFKGFSPPPRPTLLFRARRIAASSFGIECLELRSPMMVRAPKSGAPSRAAQTKRRSIRPPPARKPAAQRRLRNTGCSLLW
jgi:hypothetical protein